MVAGWAVAYDNRIPIPKIAREPIVAHVLDSINGVPRGPAIVDDVEWETTMSIYEVKATHKC